MYRKNEQHQQIPMFSTLDDLPAQQRQRLETSWAATFYEDFWLYWTFAVQGCSYHLHQESKINARNTKLFFVQ